MSPLFSDRSAIGEPSPRRPDAGESPTFNPCHSPPCRFTDWYL